MNNAHDKEISVATIERLIVARKDAETYIEDLEKWLASRNVHLLNTPHGITWSRSTPLPCRPSTTKLTFIIEGKACRNDITVKEGVGYLRRGLEKLPGQFDVIHKMSLTKCSFVVEI